MIDASKVDVVLRHDDADDAQVLRLLESARTHLGMAVSWVTRIADGQQVVENLEGDAAAFGLNIGDASDYETSYCFRVLGGSRAGVVADARHDPRTADLPITAAIGIGAYVGAPLRLSDGRVYGMVCCFSSQAEPTLQERDAQFLAVFAELLGDIMDRRDQRRRSLVEATGRIRSILEAGGPTMVYQPVYALPDLSVVGYEALARFPAGHGGPDQWFADAAMVGLGTELELAAIRAALTALPQLRGSTSLGVNASPDVVTDDRFHLLLQSCDASRVVVEVTEHVRVTDYPTLKRATGRLRLLGVQFAADDTGAGFAGLQHLVELQPESIKIDISIVRGIHRDPARAAVATALAGYAAATNAALLAEGIETADELATVIALGATHGQGYHLSHPLPLTAIDRFTKPAPYRGPGVIDEASRRAG